MGSQDDDLPLHRLQIIVLSVAGKRVSEISESVNLHPINVRKWIHRFNRYGLDGLIITSFCALVHTGHQLCVA